MIGRDEKGNMRLSCGSFVFLLICTSVTVLTKNTIVMKRVMTVPSFR